MLPCINIPHAIYPQLSKAIPIPQPFSALLTSSSPTASCIERFLFEISRTYLSEWPASHYFRATATSGCLQGPPPVHSASARSVGLDSPVSLHRRPVAVLFHVQYVGRQLCARLSPVLPPRPVTTPLRPPRATRVIRKQADRSRPLRHSMSRRRLLLPSSDWRLRHSVSLE